MSLCLCAPSLQSRGPGKAGPPAPRFQIATRISSWNFMELHGVFLDERGGVVTTPSC